MTDTTKNGKGKNPKMRKAYIGGFYLGRAIIWKK